MNFFTVPKISAALAIIIIIFGVSYLLKKDVPTQTIKSNVSNEKPDTKRASPTIKEFNIFGNEKTFSNEPVFSTEEIPSTQNGEMASPENQAIKNTTVSSTTVKNKSELTLKEYGNVLVDSIKKAIGSTDESAIFNEMVKNKTSTDVLSVVKENYEGLSTSISSIKAPETITSVNKKLFENYKTHADEIQKLIDSKTFTQISENTWKSYVNSSMEIQKTLVEMAKFLKSQGVVFQPSESGYFFTQIVP